MIIKVTFNNCSVCADGKYKLNYTLGEITQSVPDTVGIFCYDSSEKPLFGYGLGYKSYEVEGIGEPKKIVPCCREYHEGYLNMFYNDQDKNPAITTQDTILFKAVKVIREIPLSELDFYLI